VQVQRIPQAGDRGLHDIVDARLLELDRERRGNQGDESGNQPPA
jgi:hypothetical protein